MALAGAGANVVACDFVYEDLMSRQGHRRRLAPIQDAGRRSPRDLPTTATRPRRAHSAEFRCLTARVEVVATRMFSRAAPPFLGSDCRRRLKTDPGAATEF